MPTKYENIPQLSKTNSALRSYVESAIFPRYDKFFSHGIHHIHRVIEDSLMLTEYYHKDFNIVYAAASYHDDLGLKIDRAHHEAASGEIVAADQKLLEFFSPAETTIIREAVEDHRGSRKTPPRNFYGKIISDSDRDFELTTLARRQLATSTRNYPDFTTFEQHFNRCYEYISGRITQDGHFNLWTNNPILVERRQQFEKEFLDREHCRRVYAEAYDRMSKDGTLEKVLNYYEDF